MFRLRFTALARESAPAESLVFRLLSVNTTKMSEERGVYRTVERGKDDGCLCQNCAGRVATSPVLLCCHRVHAEVVGAPSILKTSLLRTTNKKLSGAYSGYYILEKLVQGTH